ncbi:MAG: GNAT family N-acetyltransferase [Pirellulales bacterium]
MTEPTIQIRPLSRADEGLLWEAVYHAIYVPVGESPPPRSIIDDPAVARYVTGWGRHGDLGFAAQLAPAGKPLGACWLRLWSDDQRGYGYVDDNTPELSLAVWPGHRAQGTGTRLLAATLDRAGREFSAVSLSASAINPAVRLYERTGFHRVAEQGSAIVMLWKSAH